MTGLYLVADVGGTNTRVALADGEVVRQDSIRRFRNAEHDDLGAILGAYQAEAEVDALAGACAAVAGPVRDAVARMTNLDWVIDRDMVWAATKADHVAVLNDLQAQGHALHRLGENDIVRVRDQPEHSPNAARLVIGIGTGFNAAPVFNTATGRYVPPSEAGHATLPVRDESDLDLARWLGRESVFPSIEEVLSGRGLERLYAWHASDRGIERRRADSEILSRCGTGDDPVADAAGAGFMKLLGSVAGNLALTTLPFGGVYMTGGVAQAVAPHLATSPFNAAFSDKGRFGPFMENFGVAVVMDDYAALTGCAAHIDGLTRLSDGP